MTDAVAVSYQPQTPSAPPRLLTGVVLVLLQWMLIKVPAWTAPGTMAHFMAMWIGPMAGAVAIVVWWLFFSRLTWKTRLTVFGAFVLGGIIAETLSHPSMKMPLIIFALPLATSIWGVWPMIAYRLGEGRMRMTLATLLLGTLSTFTALRMDGLDGRVNAKLSWRRSPTAEDRYLASRTAGKATIATTAPALEASAADWPGFRGAQRDAHLHGTAIKTDWTANPPKRLWKHLIGPGWSSMCVVGDRIFTQEQRGPVEVVVCYQATTGNELWSHEDPDRFEESMAGPGPRATPTFDNGKLYAFGAKGRLNCLDPVTGKVLWTHDVAKESGAPLPMWGFASSPLVANGLVMVITGAKGKSIMAYKADTGAPAWSGGSGWSYCSPQITRVNGVDQLLYATNDGLTALDPLSGAVLWEHAFNIGQANRAIQPTVVNDNDVLLGAAFGIGTRRIRITQEGQTWSSKEVWTSRSIKPYYNDMVIHKGALYGFDGATFCCINLDTGKRIWRSEADYGNGQVLLLADQDLLLILSETGDVALVEAKPDAPHEVARLPGALEGKTWNHPVLAQGKLFVRNGQEIACYEMP